jgi:superfamily I DNA/RNA helicase
MRQGRKDSRFVDDEFTQTVPHLPSAAIEDIDDTEELPVLARPSAQDIDNYSRALLCYYRARKILSGNRNIRAVTRERALYAWQYLSTIVSKDLPPSLRQLHCEIVTLAVRLKRDEKSASAFEFVSEVLKITTYIDQIVDDLLTSATETN